MSVSKDKRRIITQTCQTEELGQIFQSWFIEFINYLDYIVFFPSPLKSTMTMGHGGDFAQARSFVDVVPNLGSLIKKCG